jgi:hypothetical protein
VFDIQNGDHLLALRHSDSYRYPLNREAGNVFFALFGTIVLLAALGATVTSFIKGPLTSSVQVTRANAAETQMAVITQVITMQASSVGQCDADSVVEPIQWRNPTGSEPVPTNGGLVPLTLGVASTKDPWGSEFGYCVWDHGPTTCPGGRRLAGTSLNSDAHTVIAIISAGPDKRFTTTCRTFAAADVTADGDLDDPTDFPLVSKASSTDDDIIYTYSYQEATTASGGLWSLKSGDEDVATIDKNIEVGGSGIFTSGGQFSSLNTDSVSARTGDFINMMQGFRIPDAAGFNVACDNTLNGVLRRSASGLDVCLDNHWRAATGTGGSGGGGGAGAGNLETGTADDCDNTRTGDIRFNSNTLSVEYCNGTSWQSLLTRSVGAALSILPTHALTMTVEGPCVTTNCPNAFGDPVHFVVTNLAANATGVLSVSVSSYDGGAYILDSTQAGRCHGATLAAGGTCIIRLVPAASGNGTFHGVLNVLDGATPRLNVPLRTVATSMTCAVGSYGWGGIVASCLNNMTPDYIINPAGCSGQSVEPDCNGNSADDPSRNHSSSLEAMPKISTRNSGAQNIANAAGYGFLSPAYRYCDSLIKNGYDDWYLPSYWELTTILRINRVPLAFHASRYWTSTYANAGWNSTGMMSYDFNDPSGFTTDGAENVRRVRCLRRHGQPPVTAELDTSPLARVPRYSNTEDQPNIMRPTYTVVPNQQVFMEDFVIRSTNASVPIVVAGPGAPTLRINGEAPATSGTVRNGDTVSVMATGPAVQGTENAYSILVGDRMLLWRVAYPADQTRRIFVTSTTYNGALGITGPDTHCQTRAAAAALPGNWYAIIGNSWMSPEDRIPWGWNRVENMAGNIVATSIVDLFDLATEAPVDYNEMGARLTNANPWMGVGLWDNSTGFQPNQNCQNWTSSAAGQRGNTGSPSAISRHLLMHSEFACNTLKNLYCMGPF